MRELPGKRVAFASDGNFGKLKPDRPMHSREAHIYLKSILSRELRVVKIDLGLKLEGRYRV